MTMCAGLEFVVVDAGGLDDDEALLAVDAGGVAEGVEHEAAANELEVGFEDLFAKFFEQHDGSFDNAAALGCGIVQACARTSAAISRSERRMSPSAEVTPSSPKAK